MRSLYFLSAASVVLLRLLLLLVCFDCPFFVRLGKSPLRQTAAEQLMVQVAVSFWRRPNHAAAAAAAAAHVETGDNNSWKGLNCRLTQYNALSLSVAVV
jgi:hypothetical protein